MNTRSFVSLLLLAFVAASPALAQRVLFVDAAAGGRDDGTSWADAFTALQDALAAAEAGDEIWVAAGVYRPDQGRAVVAGDRAASFQLKDGVALYGGFAGTESRREERDWEVNVTVLSGDLLGNDNDNIDVDEPTRSDNSYHVLKSRTKVYSTLTVDGFTIQAGNAVDFSDRLEFGLAGGGIHIIDLLEGSVLGTYRLAHLIVEANAASGGGGVFIWNAYRIEMEHVTFRNNSAGEGIGGGLYSFDSTPELRHVDFIDNVAGVGGAAYIEGRSGPAIAEGRPVTWRQGLIQGNVAWAWAGAVHLSETQLEGVNLFFAGNRTHQFEGGAMTADEAEAMLVNVVFTGNKATQDGGAYANWASRLTLIHATFWGNCAGRRGGAIYSFGGDVNPDFATMARNSIFWDNTATEAGPDLYNERLGPTRALFAHTLIRGGLPEGTEDGGGNLFSDPFFVDPDGRDDLVGTLDDNLRLEWVSPSIDTGDLGALPPDAFDLNGNGDTAELLPVDLDGRMRVFDGGSGQAVADMGAYEFGAPVINTRLDAHNPSLIRDLLIDVFPYPVRKRAFVRLHSDVVSGTQFVTIRLFDPLGRLVRTIFQGTVLPNHPIDLILDVSGLPSGLYFLDVRDSTQSTIKKVIVQK